IPADVVPARLGIILDGEDYRFGPEPASANGLGDLAEGKVIIGHVRCGSWGSSGGAACVIVRKADDREIGKTTFPFELPQFLNEFSSAEDVRNAHIPSNRIRVHVVAERFDGRAAPNLHLVSLFDKISIHVDEFRLVPALWIAPMPF